MGNALNFESVGEIPKMRSPKNSLSTSKAALAVGGLATILLGTAFAVTSVPSTSKPRVDLFVDKPKYTQNKEVSFNPQGYIHTVKENGSIQQYAYTLSNDGLKTTFMYNGKPTELETENVLGLFSSNPKTDTSACNFYKKLEMIPVSSLEEQVTQGIEKYCSNNGSK